MANHEMNTTCPYCGEGYDLRLRDTCPRCSEKKSRISLITILLGLGFKLSEYFDRDFEDFDNIKEVEFRKDIAHGCAIVYSEYHVDKVPGKFELKEQTAELLVGDSSVQLIYGEVSDLLKVYAMLNKHLKR